METSDGPNLYSPFKLRFFPFVADGNDEEARKFRFRRGNNWVKIKPGDLPWKSWWSLKRNEGGGEREREVKVHSTSTHRSCGSHDDAIALGWNIFSFFFFVTHESKPVNRVHTIIHTLFSMCLSVMEFRIERTSNTEHVANWFSLDFRGRVFFMGPMERL